MNRFARVRRSLRVFAPLLALLAPASFFVCVLAVTNAALQATGGQGKTVVSLGFGAVVKAVSAEILLRKTGIAGAPLSTLLSYFCAAGLNLWFLKPLLRERPAGEGRRGWLAAALLSSLFAGGSALFVFGKLAGHISRDGAALCAVFAAAAVYAASILLTGALGREEALSLAGRMGFGKRKEVCHELEGTEGKTHGGGGA